MLQILDYLIVQTNTAHALLNITAIESINFVFLAATHAKPVQILLHA